jgi:hypothetical protein
MEWVVAWRYSVVLLCDLLAYFSFFGSVLVGAFLAGFEFGFFEPCLEKNGGRSFAPNNLPCGADSWQPMQDEIRLHAAQNVYAAKCSGITVVDLAKDPCLTGSLARSTTKTKSRRNTRAVPFLG